MTDHTDTQSVDPSKQPDDFKTLEEIKQEIIVQIASYSGDRDASLDYTRTLFEDAYALMQRHGADTTSLEASWSGITALYEQTGTAIDIAATAQALAQDLRDKLQVQEEAFADTRRAHNELKLAIHRADTSHPDINPLMGIIHDEIFTDVYELATEEAMENILDSGLFTSDCPACDIINALNLDPDEHSIAHSFHDYVIDGSDLNDDERRDLATFVRSFTARVETRWNAQRRGNQQ